jgi:hypothetical protein
VTEVEGVPGGYAYGRSLNDAKRRTREALEVLVTDASTAKLDMVPDLPAEASHLVDSVAQARENFEDVRRSLSRQLVEASAVLLYGLSLSRRDAGQLLGLSHQRIQQLIQGAASRPASPKVSGVVKKSAGTASRKKASAARTSANRRSLSKASASVERDARSVRARAATRVTRPKGLKRSVQATATARKAKPAAKKSRRSSATRPSQPR